MVRTEAWGYISPDQENIAALKSEVDQLKKESGNNTTGKTKGKKKGGRKKKKGIPNPKDKFSWNKIPPKYGELETKSVDAKQYNW